MDVWNLSLFSQYVYSWHFLHNFIITHFSFSGAAFCQQKVSVWWQKTNSWRYSLCLSRFRFIHNSASARFRPDFQMAVGEVSGKITLWWHRCCFFSHWHRFYQANVELWISRVLQTYIKVCIVSKIQVNLCQKLLFLHQVTHNMTKDCSLNYEFSTWKLQCCVHKLFWMSKQKQKTIYVSTQHVLSL